MIRYKATNEYAHFGEVYLINGKGYALRWEIDNSAPCGNCALFNNITTDTEKMCMHPDKDKRMCKHESGTSKGWNTYEYVHIPDGNIIPDEQLSLATLTKKDLLEASISWFDNIAKLAEERKTNIGVYMDSEQVLEEISALAKSCSYTITHHINDE